MAPQSAQRLTEQSVQPALPQPTRRERQREATYTEIVQVSRDLLAAGAELSLRAVAARMGMTAPALYRYVGQLPGAGRPGRLRDRQGRDRGLSGSGCDPARGRPGWRSSSAHRWRSAGGRWAAPASSPWSSPTPSPTAPACGATCSPPRRRDTSSTPCWSGSGRSTGSHTPSCRSSTPPSPRRSRSRCSRSTWRCCPTATAGLLWVFMNAWAALYGVVTLEVFGHLDPRIIESGAIFAAMVHEWMPRLGMDAEQDRLRGTPGLRARPLAPRPPRPAPACRPAPPATRRSRRRRHSPAG